MLVRHFAGCKDATGVSIFSAFLLDGRPFGSLVLKANGAHTMTSILELRAT